MKVIIKTEKLRVKIFGSAEEVSKLLPTLFKLYEEGTGWSIRNERPSEEGGTSQTPPSEEGEVWEVD